MVQGPWGPWDPYLIFLLIHVLTFFYLLPIVLPIVLPIELPIVLPIELLIRRCGPGHPEFSGPSPPGAARPA